ncbi:type VI secretion system tip protein VgrG, partial [bacterium]|nr:type VI secretion system tip protein VgrG [bacterium]
MSLLTKKKFSFISKGMDKKTFTVISFKGFEAISKPYEFEIILVSDNTDIDPLMVLQNPAMFTIHRDGEENVDFNGILMQFEETQEFDGYLFFKAVLFPKLWWLSLTHHNQIFLDSTVPEIMENALKDGGLVPGIDFEFRLQNIYLKLEYVCQYDESHFDFVERWAQREGIYYFFEQTPNGEKVVFTDTKISHKDLLLGKDLVYVPASGLDSMHTKEVIKSFVCKHNMLPLRVYLKDYNYLKPSLAIEGIADVDENGRGENYIYGEHFNTPEEGNRLAKIRAEALLCRKSIFHGESSVPFIVPGYTFDLNDHYKEIYNRKYLVTDVSHEGHQTGYLISGLSTVLEPRDEQMFYSNTFTVIYSDEQFRAEHITQKPKISGTINAKIDAASSGQYAELDEHGRYKVILPFDRSGRFNGKASAWFRMVQLYAGQNQGMHFPLHKGTEVLLTFIDGNPDRPLIAGAVPNPETSSPVSSNNQTKSIIKTGRNPVDHSVGAAQASFGIDTAGTWTTNQSD